jgi:hypothetical protein
MPPNGLEPGEASRSHSTEPALTQSKGSGLTPRSGEPFKESGGPRQSLSGTGSLSAQDPFGLSRRAGRLCLPLHTQGIFTARVYRSHVVP